MKRTRLAKASIAQLKEQIKEANIRKKHLQNYLENLHHAYHKKQITYANFIETHHKKHDGKNIHEYINHYDNHIKECEIEIKKHKKHIIKNHTINILIFSIILIALTFAFSQLANIKLTGFLVSEGRAPEISIEKQEFFQEINIETNDSTTYEWKLENQGNLSYVNIDGLIKGEGIVKVYLDKILILDSSIFPNSKQGAIQESFFGTSSNATNASEEIPSQIKIINFSNICEETCNIESLLLNKSSYNIKIEISNEGVGGRGDGGGAGTVLKIHRINYGIIIEKPKVPEIAPEENITNITITPPRNITETNITNVNETAENMTQDFNITTIQLPGKIGESVKWKQTITPKKTGKTKISIPKDAQKIKLKEIKADVSEKEMSPSQSGPSVLEISIGDSSSIYELEYETPAPSVLEETISRGKRIKISSPDGIHYTNVLAFTNLPESLKLKDPSRIKIHWIEQNTYLSPSSVQDKDSNGIYDYIEWLVPSLSNQTFEIIVITKAEHLDKDKNFLSDIYEEVKKLDGIWSETIPNQDYVRVTFEKNLTSSNDITIYPRKISGSPKIEVYEKDSSTKIAEFTNIQDNQYNKVLLTSLQNSQETFDLKVVGGSVEIDHIVDPTNVLTTYYFRGISSSGNVSNQSLGTSTGSAVADWVATGNQSVYFISSSFAVNTNLSGAFPIGIWCNASNSTLTKDRYINLYRVLDCTDSACGTKAQICSSPLSFNCNQIAPTYRSNSTGCSNSSGYLLPAGHFIGTELWYNGTYRGYVLFNSSGNNSQLNVTKVDLNPIAALGTNPANANTTASTTAVFDAKCTDDIDSTLSALEIWTNDTGTWAAKTTQSSPTNATWYNLSTSGLSNSSFIWGIRCNDSSGGEGWSSNRTIIVDAVAPNLTFGTNPVDNYNSSSKSVTFDLKIADNVAVNYLALYGNWSGSWIANQTNATPLNNSWWNVTVASISDGKYVWAAWGNDTVGNSAFTSANRTFIVDTTAPTITLPAYTNATQKQNTATLTLNISATDVTTLPVSCSIEVNGTNTTLSVSNGWCNTTSIPLTSLADGNRTINVYVNDSAGNLGLNNSYVVNIISQVAPTIGAVNAISAQNPTESSTKAITFNFTATDANGGSTINISTAAAYFQFSGETTRQNTSCINTSVPVGNDINFTCTISMQYFDKPAAWTINATIKDNSGSYAENSSTTFTYNTLTSMVMSPTSLGWDQIVTWQTNVGSNNDPILINNTGNDEVLDTNVTAYNLRGETTTTEFIYAANFSIQNISQGCSGTTMANATSKNITSALLQRGNNSLNYGNFTSGQQNLYFCLTGLPSSLSQQSYSSSKKKKGIKEDRLVKALGLIMDELKEKYTLDKKELLEIIIKEMKERYGLSEKEIAEIIEMKQKNIPVSIFTKELGALESLVKYMKENLGMNYREISKQLLRDERTIWTAYKKAYEKKKDPLMIKEKGYTLPIEIFKNRKLTILESIVVHLKEKGLKYSEISSLVERDQRNIGSIYKKAVKK
ncbi:hypothetical protein HY212_03200 [Candidatus Pacearchaeota archaeon]|nr:hypothetical protein [Candidatus Pacearchaeota archaeon]